MPATGFRRGTLPFLSGGYLVPCRARVIRLRCSTFVARLRIVVSVVFGSINVVTCHNLNASAWPLLKVAVWDRWPSFCPNCWPRFHLFDSWRLLRRPLSVDLRPSSSVLLTKCLGLAGGLGARAGHVLNSARGRTRRGTRLRSSICMAFKTANFALRGEPPAARNCST